MAITKEMKQKLFERMLWMEHMGEAQQEGKIFGPDNVRDWFSESEGAFKMLEVLGLGKEYIRWAIGK